MAILYGKNRITYNAYVFGHMSEYVRMYGSSTEWDTYDFEDFNGFIKSIVHGTDRIDREIVNTLKICNSFSILKHILHSKTAKANEDHKVLMKFKQDLNEVETNKIIEFCREHDIEPDALKFFSRIHINKEVYTSIKYSNSEKKRLQS